MTFLEPVPHCTHRDPSSRATRLTALTMKRLQASEPPERTKRKVPREKPTSVRELYTNKRCVHALCDCGAKMEVSHRRWRDRRPAMCAKCHTHFQGMVYGAHTKWAVGDSRERLEGLR
jgi:hypothetical protein